MTRIVRIIIAVAAVVAASEPAEPWKTDRALAQKVLDSARVK
jgi:hypothetical protein